MPLWVYRTSAYCVFASVRGTSFLSCRGCHVWRAFFGCSLAAIWLGLNRCGLQLGKLPFFQGLLVHDSEHLHTPGFQPCACRA